MKYQFPPRPSSDDHCARIARSMRMYIIENEPCCHPTRDGARKLSAHGARPKKAMRASPPAITGQATFRHCPASKVAEQVAMTTRLGLQALPFPSGVFHFYKRYNTAK